MFAAYEAAHTRMTTWVVAPPMLFEAVAALALVWDRPQAVGAGLAWLGVGFLVVFWLSTALVQVPQHAVLAVGFDHAAHRTLVLSNWIRTIAWSLPGLLVVGMLAMVMR